MPTTLELFSEATKHLKPATLLNLMNAPLPYYEHKRWYKIATGELTTKTDWQSEQYEGSYSPSDVRKWLEQWDDSWAVELNYGDYLSVSKSEEIPLTQEDINYAIEKIKELGEWQEAREPRLVKIARCRPMLDFMP